MSENCKLGHSDTVRMGKGAGPGKLLQMFIHFIALFRGQNEEVNFAQFLSYEVTKQGGSSYP